MRKLWQHLELQNLEIQLGDWQRCQLPEQQLRRNEETTPKVTRAASAATFHGWKDVDLIVRLNVVEEDDDLNEGFCHYSIIDDE